ncbi:MAG: heat-inducible transcriptional repressor HrcA [Actinomycetota bacterium]
MIPDRSLEVLRAIVQDFVTNNQPVGSKALLERHPLGVSAATIRNDMAILEEEKLITAPHTSSGRVPTELGYRLFVDRLAELKPLSAAEREAIELFLLNASDLDDLVERSARLLAQLTNLLAVVQYPALGKSRVRHIELISLRDSIMLMLITDAGRVQQLVLEDSDAVEETLLQDLRARLNGILQGAPLADVSAKLGNLPNDFSPENRALVGRVVSALLALVAENRQEKVVLSGAANLVRLEGDFNGQLSQLLEVIESQTVLLKLMNESYQERHGVGLRIGSDLGISGVETGSLLAAGYQQDGAEVAKLGLLGPTRMDYSASISAVRAVANYISKFLEGRG